MEICEDNLENKNISLCTESTEFAEISCKQEKKNNCKEI